MLGLKDVRIARFVSALESFSNDCQTLRSFPIIDVILQFTQIANSFSPFVAFPEETQGLLWKVARNDYNLHERENSSIASSPERDFV